MGAVPIILLFRDFTNYLVQKKTTEQKELTSGYLVGRWKSAIKPPPLLLFIIDYAIVHL